MPTINLRQSIPRPFTIDPGNPLEPVAYPGMRRSVPARPVQRRPDRAAGVGLEKLAHAIEYLTITTLIARGGVIEARVADMEAIAMLKAASRELYASQPVRVPWWERIFSRAPRPGVDPRAVVSSMG